MNIIQSMIHKKLGEIRIIKSEDGNPMNTKFCAADVARALGYSNTRDAISRHCRYVVNRDIPHPQNPEKTISMNFIPLSDVFALINRSNKPEAIEFQDWINDKVLPALYQFGTYTVENHIINLEFTNPIFNPKDIASVLVNSTDMDNNTPIYNNGIDMSFDNRYLVYSIGVLFNQMLTPLYQNQQSIYNRLNQIESKIDMIVPAKIIKKED